MQQFYHRDNVSVALPGKREAKKVGKDLKQRRVFSNYLSNLHKKFSAENPQTKLLFSTFARMNSGSGQVQTLLAACRRFTMMRISDNSPG